MRWGVGAGSHLRGAGAAGAVARAFEPGAWFIGDDLLKRPAAASRRSL